MREIGGHDRRPDGFKRLDEEANDEPSVLGHGQEEQNMSVFCIPGRMFRRVPYFHAALTALLHFSAFVAHDYFQELLVRRAGGNIPLSMTASEFGMCTLGALIQLALRTDQPSARDGDPVSGQGLEVPLVRRWTLYVMLTLLLLGSLTMGTVALKWVAFPVR